MAVATAVMPRNRSWLIRPNVFTALLGGIIGFVLVQWVLGHDGGLLTQSGPIGLGWETDQISLAAYATAVVGFFIGLGYFNFPVKWLLGRQETIEEQADVYGVGLGPEKYFRLCLDHKVVGIQYLVAVLAFFCIGGFTAMLIRTELLTPNVKLVDPEVYLTLVTEHSVTMLVMASSIIIGPFGNYFVPLMIGAKRMAFPRIEALSFWTFLLALLILPTMFFFGGDQGGWTGYAPLADQLHAGHNAYITCWALAGFSMTVSAINILATVLLMRAPGMSWSRLNTTVWAVVVASILAWLAAPIMIAVQLMVAYDRAFLTGLFVPVQGGSPFLYENVFWTFGHPEVYILAVPAFGIILDIVPVFARKPVYTYKAAVVAMFGIGLLSWFVWQHHLFVSGLTPGLRPFFMFSTEMISFPTGIIFLAGLGTLFGARIRFNSAMLFALAFFPNFLLGGFSGIFVSDVPADVQLHGSYWVQAHFHFVLMGGTLFAFFAAVFYWFPKITGRKMNEFLGQLQFWPMFIGFNGTFLTLALVGIQGMSRRYATYEPSLQTTNDVATAFAYILGLSIIPFLINIVVSWQWGEKAEENPWNSRSLEWLTTTPVPVENFEEIPLVVAGPYQYGLPAEKVHPMAVLRPSEQSAGGAVPAGS
ncbi:MAG TPA: cbb3-type cytochrome c oxidase subunit I [Chloroflexota bacterium]|nr:cbb3-type cytochrome c oxidase subunit I [Chloroflexota bacterium]